VIFSQVEAGGKKSRFDNVSVDLRTGKIS
jgi:hypothetical protein